MAQKKTLNPNAKNTYGQTNVTRRKKLLGDIVAEKTATTKKGTGYLKIEGKTGSNSSVDLSGGNISPDKIKAKTDAKINAVKTKIGNQVNEIQNQIPIDVKAKLKKMSKGVKYNG